MYLTRQDNKFKYPYCYSTRLFLLLLKHNLDAAYLEELALDETTTTIITQAPEAYEIQGERTFTKSHFKNS